MSGTMLPHDVLSSRRVALSISESDDLERLGLLDAHLRLAVAEVARAVVTAAGHLAYGGHLRPDGYTAFLADELERRYRRENVLTLFVAWPVHRRMSLTRLRAARDTLPIAVRAAYLDLDGETVDPLADRGEEIEDVTAEDAARGLTAMRAAMTAQTHARVLIGGKRNGYGGRMPGLVEEALMAVEAGRPLFLAAGFGGMTFDIAAALNLGTEWFPPAYDGSEPDRQTSDGLRLLTEAVERKGGRMPPNGLTEDENRQLVASHRPGESASLIRLGMGRTAQVAGNGDPT